MVGHLHLQAMDDSLKGKNREGLLDSPDSGLPPSPSPPFYSLSPGLLESRSGSCTTPVENHGYYKKESKGKLVSNSWYVVLIAYKCCWLCALCIIPHKKQIKPLNLYDQDKREIHLFSLWLLLNHVSVAVTVVYVCLFMFCFGQKHELAYCLPTHKHMVVLLLQEFHWWTHIMLHQKMSRPIFRNQIVLNDYDMSSLEYSLDSWI